MPLFRGFAIETHPTRFEGLAIETPETHLHGVAIEVLVEGVTPPDLSPLQTNFEAIACPGKVVEPKLTIAEGTGGVFLQALNEEHLEVMHLRQGGFVSLPEAALKIGGGQSNPAALNIVDEECRQSICLDGSNGLLIAGCEYKAGSVEIHNDRDQTTVLLDGANGRVTMGGEGIGGELWVLAENQTQASRNPDFVPHVHGWNLRHSDHEWERYSGRSGLAPETRGRNHAIGLDGRRGRDPECGLCRRV